MLIFSFFVTDDISNSSSSSTSSSSSNSSGTSSDSSGEKQHIICVWKDKESVEDDEVEQKDQDSRDVTVDTNRSSPDFLVAACYGNRRNNC